MLKRATCHGVKCGIIYPLQLEHRIHAVGRFQDVVIGGLVAPHDHLGRHARAQFFLASTPCIHVMRAMMSLLKSLVPDISDKKPSVGASKLREMRSAYCDNARMLDKLVPGNIFMCR